jgi:hypothetical protein
LKAQDKTATVMLQELGIALKGGTLPPVGHLLPLAPKNQQSEC